ncbi:MAG: maleylpyruvate isomerase family mycothiol-dependent enzyme [Acidimicrobiales bacterium]|jgi:uncharacterized protein (TIGR03083 family)
MEASLTPWVAALRRSHDTLALLVGPLGTEELQRRSYDSEWSIAQVLSHLGSQSEIFGLFLEAGLSRQDPPGGEVFAPIWEAWNTRDPQSLATGTLKASETVVGRFESLTPDEIERFHLNLFGMELDATGLSRLRLSELALHTWDVAVALDPTAKVLPDAVALLVDTLGQLAARGGKPDGTIRRVLVTTTEPERHFILETGETVVLTASGPDAGEAGLSLPAEAFVRLLYGRLDPAHTPVLEVRGIDLDELRRVFPGI